MTTLALIYLTAFFLTVPVTYFLMKRAAQNRIRKRLDSKPGGLTTPVEIVLAALIFSSIVIFGSILAIFNEQPFLGFVGLIGSVLMIGISLPLNRTRFGATVDGLTACRRFQTDRHIAWTMVRRVSISRKSFQFDSSIGTRIKVPFMLIGLPDFAEQVLNSVAVEAIDPNARELLAATARGDLPKTV